MFYHKRFIPGLAIYSYMVGDESTKEMAIIDPTRDIDEYLNIAQVEGYEIRFILETHVHADFVSGAFELKHALGGKPIICCSGMGGKEWTPTYVDKIIQDGDQISLGRIKLKAIHSPGHTPEHVTWLVFDEGRSKDTPLLLFSGDFLFVGDVGRPDLLGDKAGKLLAHQLYESVFKTLEQLPDSLEIHPGHGAGSLCGKAIGTRPTSTLGYERKCNPSLQKRSEEEWVVKLLENMPAAPPHFRRLKQINVEGPKLLQHRNKYPTILSAKETHNLRKKALLIDTRQKEPWASSHIPGSINIPMGPTFSWWAEWILKEDQPIVIICDNLASVKEINDALIRIGFDNVEGFFPEFSKWENQGFETERIEGISAQELEERLSSSNPPLIIDVRTNSEWKSGHIEGAKHIMINELEKFKEIPKDQNIAVLCSTGLRASIFASLLKKEGFEHIANVFGGMTAWDQRQESMKTI